MNSVQADNTAVTNANTEHTPDEKAVISAAASRRKWKILAGIVIIGVMFYLLYKQSKKNKTRSERQGGTDSGPFSRLLGGIVDFDRSGDSRLVRDAESPSAGGIVPRKTGVTPGMPSMGLENETDETLFKLAKDLKEAGFTIYGRTQCRWTKVQRDMFGDIGAKARKELESMYVECVTSEMCPNVKGYPTWISGDRQFGGFQPPAKLRLMAKEMSIKEPRQMLQAAPVPLTENIPDEKHNADIPKTLTPEMAKTMMYEMLKDMRANESASEIAAVESDRSGAGVSINPTGGVGIGAKVETEDEQTETSTPKKENARGVSAYAPLAVPDMPGTAPMNLDVQQADFQNIQGNVPRVAVQNHDASAAVARQVVQSFNNLENNAHRDPNASAFSQVREPHSVSITTGETLADRRVPFETQPGSGQ